MDFHIHRVPTTNTHGYLGMTEIFGVSKSYTQILDCTEGIGAPNPRVAQGSIVNASNRSGVGV